MNVKNSTYKTEIFAVTGMMCAVCAGSVQTMLNSLAGVESASVNYAASNVLVVYDHNKVTPVEMALAIESIGYQMIAETDTQEAEIESAENERLSDLKNRMIIATVFTLPVFAVSMFHLFHFEGINWFLMILSIPVIFYSGAIFYKNAYNQAKHRMVNMDTLVALSTGIAFIYSVFNTISSHRPTLGSNHNFVYYESATVIITFILAGKYLEERSKRKTLAAVKELASLQPKNVSVTRNNQQLLIPASMVLPDDVVEITTGERIPVDGVVITGSSFIDESMVTGEPIPVQKTTGDKVYAGTLNSNGFLTLSATKSGRETLLSEIIRLVKEAQSAKPPIQLLADKIASVFVPVVLVIAVLTFVIWWFAGPENQPGLALITTISVLIIACPCALGLATPTALMAGLGKGASSGILIRNTEQLENLCKTKALVLDKTGTLTYGKPMVSESYWFIESLNLKRILYSIQRQSTHPLAKAVVAHLGIVEPIPTDAFSEIGGKGLLATVEGKNYVVGNRVFLEENKISIPDQLPEGTHVLFAENQSLVAYFMIEDQLKDHAIEAISAIKKLGITPVMLTGDSKKTAARIAALAGINTYFAEVLPTDKHQIISTLKTKYSHVAMVGDGINDSAALASADAGIAMGGGSDIAINSAGIILMNNDLRLLSQAVKLSKATVRTIRQNFFWAFFYNIIAIPVAAGILFPLNGFLLNPMIAGAAMALSSVTVVTNSLRLRKIVL